MQKRVRRGKPPGAGPAIVGNVKLEDVARRSRSSARVDEPEPLYNSWCTTDTLAIGALAEARRWDFACRRNSQLHASTISKLPHSSTRPLTIISVPAVDIGRTAAEYLLSAFTGSTRRRAVLLPYRLIIRGSAGVPHSVPFPIAAPSKLIESKRLRGGLSFRGQEQRNRGTASDGTRLGVDHGRQHGKRCQ